MVSELPFGPWGIKSGDEKQVEDRAAETKIDGIQLEIHEDMKTLKSEINKVMSGMMEKMDLIMKKWDRKDIGIAINLTGNNVDPEISPKNNETGKGTVRRSCREKVVVRENRILIEIIPSPSLEEEKRYEHLVERVAANQLNLEKNEGKLLDLMDLDLGKEVAQSVDDRNEMKQAQLQYRPSKAKTSSYNPNAYSPSTIHYYSFDQTTYQTHHTIGPVPKPTTASLEPEETGAISDSHNRKEDPGKVEVRDHSLYVLIVERMAAPLPTISDAGKKWDRQKTEEKERTTFKFEILPRIDKTEATTGGRMCRGFRSLFNILVAPFSTLPQKLFLGNLVNGFQTMLQHEGLGQLLKWVQRLQDKNELIKHATPIYSPNKNGKKFPSPNSWTVSIEATGYGICMDKILMMDERLATHVNSCSKLNPKIVQLNGNLNFEVEHTCTLRTRWISGQRVMIDV